MKHSVTVSCAVPFSFAVDQVRGMFDLAARRRERFDNSERTRQRVLVEGMDCLAGQQDLF